MNQCGGLLPCGTASSTLFRVWKYFMPRRHETRNAAALTFYTHGLCTIGTAPCSSPCSATRCPPAYPPMSPLLLPLFRPVSTRVLPDNASSRKDVFEAVKRELDQGEFRDQGSRSRFSPYPPQSGCSGQGSGLGQRTGVQVQGDLPPLHTRC